MYPTIPQSLVWPGFLFSQANRNWTHHRADTTQ